MTIPKILHQLWIGPKPAPTNLMDTWREKNPDFEYMRWNEDLIKEKQLNLTCVKRINDMEEINGQADIIRWEILYEYGGFFQDADSICIESIDNNLMSLPCFAGWENEQVRQGLIATGTMGFPPKHPLVKAAIEWIQNNDINVRRTGARAWKTVGPGLLTRMYNTGNFPDLKVLPSYFFLPIHCTGLEYNRHGKIYAYQEWGSTKQNYDTMNNITLPEQFLPSQDKVSILISSLDTKAAYIKACLESIKDQVGNFMMEVIWINDGSNEMNTTLLKRMLKNFEHNTRFTTVIYHENDGNKGIGYTLNLGINLCNNEIIIKMDSDDIMVPDRIIKQLEFMKNNEHVAICGGQIQMFNGDKVIQTTHHPPITWNSYIQKRSHWFINHPTVCYRKSKVLEAGNYNKELKQMAEDFELELRMLKTHKYIHNLPDTLLYYRLHDEQVTYNGGKQGRRYWDKVRNDIIDNLINN
jgi:GT2 family glycosyltransferase